MDNRRILVVGVGDDGARGVSETVLERVRACPVLYGGSRQLEFFAGFGGAKRLIGSPLKETLDAIERDAQDGAVAVLASGDPLFFGIGSTLVRRLGRDRVEVLPNVSSVQLAFARAGVAWQDARLISLHGKSIRGLAQRVHGAAVAALLTDGESTPGAIARYLLAFGMTEYAAFVAEHLGSPEERAAWYTLDEMAASEYSDLNTVLLVRREDASHPVFAPGMADEAYAQRKPDRGLITKREIRVLSLAGLALHRGDVLWDIGACTGSVSIEAILSTPDVQVYAVEKNAADLENLHENQVKFRADFVALHARAPEGLDTFPDPDAVFIGGSGGELEELLQVCARRLREGGRIVLNVATIEHLHAAHQALLRLGFEVSVTLIQTARSRPILHLTRFEGMNPVYLVVASREGEGEGKEDPNDS